jgi:protein phosphatase PTC7
VADGVGGWREYGIDPSKFSSSLMDTCKRLIEQEKLNIHDSTSKTPIQILTKSYNTLLDSKNSLIGSSTACIVIFNRDTEFIHAANLGDSGFVIIRNNKIVHRSQEQQHYFNSPFQLAIHPNMNDQDSLISDRPESASTSSFKVIEGDFILVATDGLWDNLPENSLIHEISKIKVNLFFFKNFLIKI